MSRAERWAGSKHPVAINLRATLETADQPEENDHADSSVRA